MKKRKEKEKKKRSKQASQDPLSQLLQALIESRVAGCGQQIYMQGNSDAGSDNPPRHANRKKCCPCITKRKACTWVEASMAKTRHFLVAASHGSGRAAEPWCGGGGGALIETEKNPNKKAKQNKGRAKKRQSKKKTPLGNEGHEAFQHHHQRCHHHHRDITTKARSTEVRRVPESPARKSKRLS